ncbi:MAG TPA: TAXI family TRAP transporter solute-binding subunit, partial [Candidatus Binatia bacterium]
MKRLNIGLHISLALSLLLLPGMSLRGIAEAKLDCSPTANSNIALPRTVAIASNLPGTGAHALASGLSAVASKVTTMSAKVQPYNGPNAWMPLLEEGEVEFGIINILDSNMAATGTGNYKKAYPTIRIVAGGVFPFTGSIMVRDKSEIKTGNDLKGKRMAWDFGGHAITQTWQNAAMEVLGVKP